MNQKTKSIAFFAILINLLTLSITYATLSPLTPPPVGGYDSGSNSILDPGCAPNAVDCVVNLPSGSSITADNGLTATGSNVQLGGTLLQNTTINQSGFNTIFTGGRVGINTSTPGFDLDVGNTAVTTQSSVDGPYFGGTINDGTFDTSGYAGPADNNFYGFYVSIPTLGTPDEASWSDDFGNSGTFLITAGVPQTLSNGVTITFANDTGHAGDEYFEIYAKRENQYTVTGGITNTASQYNVGGDFFATQNRYGSVFLGNGVFTDPALQNSFFVGAQSGSGATSANNSNFLGYYAGYGATSAASSNFLGHYAGNGATNAYYSNFLGHYAGSGATSANNSNFLGHYAGSGATSAASSNFLGHYAGNGATNAYTSNFLGHYAGNGATSANNSNFLGLLAGYGATDAYYSNFLGTNAGDGATSANNSNFLGVQAGFYATNAHQSNFLGASAGDGATSANNSNFLGVQAGYGATNANNSNFLGVQAGYRATNANNSNFLGANAGENTINSHHSTFIGSYAGADAINAAQSIFIGRESGVADTVDNTTNLDDFSILLGNNTSTGGFSNSIAIGSFATNTLSNQFMIGSTTRPIDETKIIGSAGTECTITTGTGVACTSDERLKTNITDLNSDTLTKLQNVRTVSYNWLQNPNSPLQIGFLAQNLEQYFPEMVMTDVTGKKQVYYSQMTPILTKAIQELNLKVDMLTIAGGNTSSNIFEGLIAWLENTGNGIRSIVVKDKICVDDQCLTRDDIRGLLEMKNQGNTTTVVIPPVVVPTTDPVTDPIDNQTPDPILPTEPEQPINQIIPTE